MWFRIYRRRRHRRRRSSVEDIAIDLMMKDYQKFMAIRGQYRSSPDHSVRCPKQNTPTSPAKHSHMTQTQNDR